MAADNHIIEELALINRRTLLERQQVLLLVGECDLFHGIYVT